MKTSQKVLIAITPLPAILILIVIASIIMSPPWAGSAIAAKKGLKRPLAIAHRGASYYAPENTLASFALARDLGADYVETDVQRTRDGVLILLHDDDLSRTTDVAVVFPGREKDPIGTFTWAELKCLDAGSWFNNECPDRAKKGFVKLAIPTFKEYLALLSSGKNRPGLLIELKKPERYPSIEREVLAELRAGRWIDRENREILLPAPEDDGDRVTIGLGRNRVILQSFDEKSLAVLKEIAPAITRNLLMDEDDVKKKGSFAALLDAARALDAEIGPSGYIAWPWNVGAAHRMDRFFFIYTLDKEWHFVLFTFFGIDGVITNRCDAYLDFIGRPAPGKASSFLKQYE